MNKLVGLLAVYSIAIIAGGHGAGPVGLLLFLGRAPEWVWGQVLGVGAILIAIAVYVAYRKSQRLSPAGLRTCALAFYASWLAFAIGASDSGHVLAGIAGGAIFSAPLQIYCIFLIVDAIHAKQSAASSQTGQL